MCIRHTMLCGIPVVGLLMLSVSVVNAQGDHSPKKLVLLAGKKSHGPGMSDKVDWSKQAAHPICRGLKPFTFQDEYYGNVRFLGDDPRFMPILPFPGKPKQSVWAWAWQRDNSGRSFVFIGGHTHKNWQIDDPFVTVSRHRGRHSRWIRSGGPDAGSLLSSRRPHHGWDLRRPWRTRSSWLGCRSSPCSSRRGSHPACG